MPVLTVLGTFILVVILSIYFLNQNITKTTLQYKALKPFSVLNGEEKDPEFSKDGEFVAFSHRANPADYYKIYIQPATGSAVSITQGDGDDVSPSWSPDRKAIVFVRMLENQCHIMKVKITEDVYQESKILNCNGHGLPNEVIWGADDYIYYNHAETSQEPYKIYRYSIKTGKKEQLTNPEVGHSKGDIFFAVSNDDKFLAYKRDLNWGGTQVELMELKTKEARKLFNLSGWKKGLSWSNDGLSLFYIDTDNKIRGCIRLA